MAVKKTLPPTYFIVAILLSVAFHFLLPIKVFVFYPWNLIGILSILFGIYLNIVADRDFKRVKTTVKPFEESSFLLKDGVFRISRNPMYLGMVFILAGIAVLFGSALPFLIAFLFGYLMDFIFIRIEEQMLEAKFGEEWLDYKSKVRRWL